MPSTVKTCVVLELGHGWYNFKEIDQRGKYVQIHALNCGIHSKAVTVARRILQDRKAEVIFKIYPVFKTASSLRKEYQSG